MLGGTDFQIRKGVEFKAYRIEDFVGVWEYYAGLAAAWSSTLFVSGELVSSMGFGGGVVAIV